MLGGGGWNRGTLISDIWFFRGCDICLIDFLEGLISDFLSQISDFLQTCDIWGVWYLIFGGSDIWYLIMGFNIWSRSTPPPPHASIWNFTDIFPEISHSCEVCIIMYQKTSWNVSTQWSYGIIDMVSTLSICSIIMCACMFWWPVKWTWYQVDINFWFSQIMNLLLFKRCLSWMCECAQK